MYYRCKEFKLKDASGADVDVTPLGSGEDAEVVAYVNELRNSITVYADVSGSSRLTVNRTPIYIVAGGYLEITSGQAIDVEHITFTNEYSEPEDTSSNEGNNEEET